MTSAAPHPKRTIELDRFGRLIFGVVLVVGVGLRLVQVLRNSPLWLDELALANGVLSGSFPGLFDGAADFAQSAPPGFLAIEWLFARAFPASDFALRVPTLLFGSLAIVATWFAAREISGERDAWVAAGLVALANALILLSGQAKPYAMDAFFAPLILGCALHYERTGTKTSWRVLFIVGAVGPLFSFGAVFANAGALAFLLARRASQRSWAAFGAMVVVWGATSLVSVIMSHRMLNAEATEMMRVYWARFYPPFPPSSLAEATWFWTQLSSHLWVTMGLREVWLFGISLLMGVVLAMRQRPGATLLIATPIVATVVAAIIRQYPFGQRLLHWTVPLFALMLGVVASLAAGWIRSRFFRPSPIVALMALAPGAFMLAGPVLATAASRPPYVFDDVAPVISRLSSAARPGDAVYVGWSAWHTWHRYQPRIGVPLGDVIIGGCPRDYPRGYLRDMDQLRGRPRVWLIFARVEQPEWPAQRARIDYLDSIGVRAESLLVAAPGVNQSARVDLYRYDLSDTARLSRASSETFPVPQDLVRTVSGCHRYDAMYLHGDGSRVVPVF